MKKSIFTIAAVLLLCQSLLPTLAFAQYTKLLDFDGNGNEGHPLSLISDGTFLYGMTNGTGLSGMGTIFKIKPDGTGYSKLLDFSGAANGRIPAGSLISDGTFLYGKTDAGGVNDMGTIFKILPDGTGYSKLLDFAGFANGRNPSASLASDGTFLYGMTRQGGTNDMGTTFKIKSDGTGYSKLLDFAGTANGSYPEGSLISFGAFLYGMTTKGGTNNLGTVFKIMPDGTGYFKLLDFSGSANGSAPSGSLTAEGTFLYGMTTLGGANNKGTIFKIMPDGTGYSKFLDFMGTSNGSYPEGDLISDGTFLFGMTAGGGTNGEGTIFKIKPDGTGYSKLLDFAGSANGRSPKGSLLFEGTFLYGVTFYGGTIDRGTIFKIMPDGTGYSKLSNFISTTDGSYPRGSLISDGTFLYGTTSEGGASGMGTIFKIKPDGTGYSKLFDFAGTVDGFSPKGSLLFEGTFLYGVTAGGGTNGVGTIFKIKPDGTGYSKLFDFTGTNGSNPNGSLISDGIFLYGMTAGGGANNEGTIFKIKPDGTGYYKLLNFEETVNGSYPSGSLFSDGTFLYGMSYFGGTSGSGTIFKIMPDGTGYSTLFDFQNQNGSNGSNPRGSLISDGTFLYGMTENGGSGGDRYCCGVIFKIMPNGTGYSQLHDFGPSSGSDGFNPQGSLISVGNFLYGMTGNGGSNSEGTIFKIKPNGTGYSKFFDFTGTANGSSPYDDLISDGSILFGMTTSGGTNNYGTIFKYKLPCTSVTFSQTKTVCAGQSITVGTHTYTTSGNYTDVLTSHQNCDSTVTTHLTVLPAITFSQTKTVCAGQSITVGTHTYTTSGNYTDVLTSHQNCDSTVTTHLTVLPAITFSQTKTVCAGQSITVGAHTYTTSGNYTDVLTSHQNCDSTVTTHLTVLPAITFSQTKTVCAGQSVTIGTHTYTTSGNYTDVLMSYQNCDSTVTTHLTVLPVIIFSQTKTLCPGQSIAVGTHTYTTSGNYTDVLMSYQNCDSTVTTHLTVLPAIAFSQTKTVCAWQSITVGTHTYTTSGNYTDVLTSYQNCDSTVTTQLIVLPAITYSQIHTLCAGQNIIVGSNTYTSSGNYTDVLISYQGCDSIVTTQLVVNSADTTVSVSNVTLTASASPAIYQWINCNNGNTPIASQTNQSFTASANGNYAVVVTQNNCSDTSSCYNIFITGIVENSLASSINIYPNPNTGNFTLEICFDNVKEKSMQIEIFNPLGKFIYIKQIQKTNGCIRETIELDGELAGGVYILRTVAGNKMESSRLLLVK